MNPLQRLFRFGKKGKLEVELDLVIIGTTGSTTQRFVTFVAPIGRR